MRIFKKLTTLQIQVENISPEIMAMVVDFIYKGKLDQLQITAEMLQAAVHLGFPQLQLRCEKFLATQLNVENVMQGLLLAHQVKSTLLLNESKAMIMKNLLQVKASQGWKSVVNNNPKILELLL